MSYNTVGIIKNGAKQKLPVVMVAPKADGPDYVEVVADGVKTYGTLLNELFTQVDMTKVKSDSTLQVAESVFHLYVIDKNTPALRFFRVAEVSASSYDLTAIILRASSVVRGAHTTSSASTFITLTDDIITSGKTITLYYDSATLDLTTRASNCVYDNSNSGLSATEVQDAIDEVVERQEGKVIAEVTSDGVKTYSEILNALISAMSETPTPHSVLRDNNQYSVFVENNGTGYKFTRTTVTSNHVTIATFYLAPGASSVYGLDYSGGSWTITDHSNTVIPSGMKFIIYN